MRGPKEWELELPMSPERRLRRGELDAAGKLEKGGKPVAKWAAKGNEKFSISLLGQWGRNGVAACSCGSARGGQWGGMGRVGGALVVFRSKYWLAISVGRVGPRQRDH